MNTCLVLIKRGCQEELIFGKVKAETTTHYLVTHETNKDMGEWFAKNSERVKCSCV